MRVFHYHAEASSLLALYPVQKATHHLSRTTPVAFQASIFYFAQRYGGCFIHVYTITNKEKNVNKKYA